MTRNKPHMTQSHKSRRDTVPQYFSSLDSIMFSRLHPLQKVSRQLRTAASRLHRPSTTRNASAAINFDDTKSAYASHSDGDLLRSIFILRLSEIDSFVDNSPAIMDVGRRGLPFGLFDVFMKKTFYGQFVGGEDHRQVVDACRRLLEAGICGMPGPSIEDVPDDVSSGGKESEEAIKNREALLDENMNALIDSVALAEMVRVSGARGAIQVKPTALVQPKWLSALSREIIGSDGLLPKITANQLHEQMLHVASAQDFLCEFESAVARFSEVAKACGKVKVNMFIDAEYHDMQPAINALALITESAHNKDCLDVWNTQQAYLKEADDVNRRHLEIADLSGFPYATKVVRGAYLEHERAHARTTNKPDPIHSSYADTNACYNRTIDVLLQRAAAGQGGVMVASHNENSINFAIERMDRMKIPKQGEKAIFAQLYGMCDYISFKLGQTDYSVYKALLYGSVESTLLYLSRRANENQFVLEGARRERQVLAAEWARRRAEQRP